MPLSLGICRPRATPVLIGGIVGLVAVWFLVGIREFADFEALQWWVYINYDFTPQVNPFTIGPFLAGIVGGYTAGYLTRGLYEHAISSAVKANLLAGGLFYFSIVLQSVGTLIGSGMINADRVLIVTIQPLMFIGIPFTLIFMGQGVVAGPVGQFVRRRLLGTEDRPDGVDRSSRDAQTVAIASFGAAAVILTLTLGTWALLYSFYLFLTPG